MRLPLKGKPRGLKQYCIQYKTAQHKIKSHQPNMLNCLYQYLDNRLLRSTTHSMMRLIPQPTYPPVASAMLRQGVQPVNVNLPPNTLEKISQDAETIHQQPPPALNLWEQGLLAVLSHPTVEWIITAGLVAGMLPTIVTLAQNKQAIATSSTTEKQQLKTTLFKQLGQHVTIGLGAGMALGSLAQLATNQYYTPKALKTAETTLRQFNATHGTNSQLSMLPDALGNLTLLAEADALSGNIVLNPLLVKDYAYSNWLLVPVLTHELKHLEQFILMARSPNNGLKRLNFILAKRQAAAIKHSPQALAEINQAYAEYQHNPAIATDKNQLMPVKGFNMPTLNFVKAMYLLLHQPQVTPEDIPFILNTAFYQKTINTGKPLSPAETAQAEAYFNALAQYPELGLFSGLDKRYRHNVLEQEAFATMPWSARL